jgi:NifU-like protein involved in Fe-S cluster formation
MLAGRDLAAARALSAAFEAFVHAPPDSPPGSPPDSPAADVTPAPDAPALGELAAFSGVRRFRSRRACAMLPLRALAAATSSAG